MLVTGYQHMLCTRYLTQLSLQRPCKVYAIVLTTHIKKLRPVRLCNLPTVTVSKWMSWDSD